MTVWVTGSQGLVGQALVRAGATGLSHAQLDITDSDAVGRALDRAQDAGAHGIINAAAQARVDLAEQQPHRTHAVNHLAVADLARQCHQRGLRLVTIGTDYSLSSQADLLPDMVPSPRGIYATSKSRGEQAAAALGAVVVRVQWVYHPGHPAFFGRTLQALAAGQTVRLVTDQLGSPTPADVVAQGLMAAATGSATGIFHLACLGETTPYLWIQAAALHLGLPFRATPITRAQLGGAPRPERSVLKSDGFVTAFGSGETAGGLPSWQNALRRALDRSEGGGWEETHAATHPGAGLSRPEKVEEEPEVEPTEDDLQAALDAEVEADPEK